MSVALLQVAGIGLGVVALFLVVVLVVVVISAIKIVKGYERGVIFRL